jgi:hypothetical protein
MILSYRAFKGDDAMLGELFPDPIIGPVSSSTSASVDADISAFRRSSIKREITHNQSRLPINPAFRLNATS